MTDPSDRPSEVAALATRQLAAYNAFDLDAFCDCYHPDVVVYDGEKLVMEGIDEFRSQYAGLFMTRSYGATVDARLTLDDHIVEREAYWRIDPETGERKEGELLVRYSARDGKLAVVQFLRGGD